MRQREKRRSVLIKARMRVGASWDDVSILNISSRGLMIHSAQAPPQGAYLEVRRGRHAIIARVVWTRDQRFGVCTQDPLSVEAIVREPDLSAPEARHSPEDSQPLERRAIDARARAAGNGTSAAGRSAGHSSSAASQLQEGRRRSPSTAWWSRGSPDR